jgi:hypothetical protein
MQRDLAVHRPVTGDEARHVVRREATTARCASDSAAAMRAAAGIARRRARKFAPEGVSREL